MRSATEEETERACALVIRIQDAIACELDNDVALLALLGAFAIEWIAVSEVDPPKTDDVAVKALTSLLHELRPRQRVVS